MLPEPSRNYQLIFTKFIKIDHLRCTVTSNF